MVVLTVDDLRKKGACRGATLQFYRLFGYSVAVCPEAAESAADEFDWVWAGRHLLSDRANKERFLVSFKSLVNDCERMRLRADQSHTEKIEEIPFLLRWVRTSYRKALEEDWTADTTAAVRWRNVEGARLFVELYLAEQTPKPKTKKAPKKSPVVSGPRNCRKLAGNT